MSRTAGPRRRGASRREWLATLLLVGLAGGLGWRALAAAVVPVSQKGRAFHPDAVTVQHGEVVEILNDDGELLHHAYVDAPDFKFDSGEQEPGSRTPIRFDKPGTYTVLCQIHPKMRLTVTVK